MTTQDMEHLQSSGGSQYIAPAKLSFMTEPAVTISTAVSSVHSSVSSMAMTPTFTTNMLPPSGLGANQQHMFRLSGEASPKPGHLQTPDPIFSQGQQSCAESGLGTLPEGIHPWLHEILTSIKSDTAKALSNTESLDNRLLILEDQVDNNGTEIAKLWQKVEQLQECNKTLLGRLIRTELKCDRQKIEIIDQKARNMRDNIIIRSRGPQYKETTDENTASKFREFVARELHVPDADKITITRAHRMGVAQGDSNRMIIAKVAFDHDIRRIFNNAKALKNTNFSMSRQLPMEMEERRQFGWAEFKKARDERRNPRFDGGRLHVGNTPITKFDPLPLPLASLSVLGNTDVGLKMAESEEKIIQGHSFRACAIETAALQDVRNGLDKLLQQEYFASASYVPFAYRLNDLNNQTIENFESDSDYNMGLQILKILRTKQALNVTVYLAHSYLDVKPVLSGKARSDSIQHVVCGALLALANAREQEQ